MVARSRRYAAADAGLAVFALLAASGAGAACDPNGAGDAAPADAAAVALNTLKTRTNPPAIMLPMPVSEMLGMDEIEDPAREAQGVVLDGYLLGTHREDPSSANCHDRRRRDIALWMGATEPQSTADALAMRARAVIAVVTPGARDPHPTWTATGLAGLVGRHVRVTGWLLFDPGPADQLGKTRGTLWEAHPALRIQVQRDDASWADF